jgi:hypothetical protein
VLSRSASSVADKVHLPVPSPVVSASRSPTGSAVTEEAFNDFRTGVPFGGGSHSMIFKPPILLPASSLDVGAAGAFTSEQNAVRIVWV